MNRVYRIIWSHARNAWVVACELAGARGKRSRGASRRNVALVTLSTALLVGLPATAADLYWDTNSTSNGLGGALGAWNTTNNFWTANSLGTSGHQSWVNTNFDNAIFNNGFGSTVTLGEAISVHNLTFQAGSYDITGGTLTLGGTTPTITNTGAFSNTISSILAGTNGMTFTGGTLTLSAANTLTGGITINSGRLITANNASNILNGANNVVTINSGGILQIANSNAFGGDTAASRLVMNNGSSLLLNEASLTHNITANGGTITIQDEVCCSTSTWTGTLTLNANTTLLVNNTGGSQSWGTTFAGNLSDTGANKLSLTFDTINSNASFLSLSGNNSFTGGITVGRGELRLASANSAGGPGNVVTLNNLSTLTVQNANAFGGDATAANLRLNSGSTLNVAGGVTLQHDVRLDQTSAAISGTGGTWNGTAVLNGGNAALTFGGTVTATGSLADNNGSVLSVTTNGSNVSFAGPLSFSGNFTVDGFDTWLKTGGTFTYTGDTIITDDARLWLNAASPISPNTDIRFEGTTAAGATVIGLTTTYPVFTQAVGSGNTEVRWNGNGGFYARSSMVDADVNLFGDKRTLIWGAGGTPGFVLDGSMLILGTDTTGSAAREVDFQNGIDLNGQLRSVRADNGSVSDHAIMSGVLTGTGGLRTIGTGALELNNTNNYTGATVVGDGATAGWGNLILGSAGALPSASNLQFDGVVNSEVLGSGGVVLLTAASGDFTRSLGAGADQVHWTRSGGFAAIGANRTVDIGGAGATLSWNSADFVPTGQALRFGSLFSSARVDFVNPIDLGAADRVVSVVDDASSSASAEVRLSGVVQGTGGLNVRGNGDIELNAANTFTGALTIGAASTTSSGFAHDDGMRVYANSIADAGTASSLGAGSSVVLSSNTGALIYNGAANASTNRALTLRDTTQFGGDAQLALMNQSTSGSLTWTGDVTTGASSNRDILVLGGSYDTTLDADGRAVNPNVISGVISNAGAALRITGTASTNHSCSANSVWRLTGANTFTGGFGTEGCTFEVASLTDGGLASSIGASIGTDAANLDLRNNGTLRYIGAGDSTNRLLRVGSNSRIESSGTGALAFTNTGPPAFWWSSSLQWLGGTNADDNSFAPTLVNSASPNDPSFVNFTLGKDGRGLWALPTNNNAQVHAYTGNTRIAGGALRVDNAGAITGGLDTISSHGATGSAQRSSLIVFEGSNTAGTPTVLGLTAASGDFLRGTTTAGAALTSTNGTSSNFDDDLYTQGVRWTGSGGFAAWDGTQAVNLFGDQRQVTWNTNGFVPTGQNLVFGYSTATGTVDFRNPINLGGAQRTIEVHRGLAAQDATLSNELSGTGGGINKTGNGILVLTADNTFTGNSAVTAGILQLGDGTASGTGSLGTSPTVSVSAGATLAVNHSDAHTLNHAINGDGTLNQIGAGATTMTVNSDIDHIVVGAGRLVTPASLFAEDVTFTNAGGATVEVGGTLRRSAGTAALVTGGALNDTFIVDAGATATVTGDLGDGNDVLEVAGTLAAAGGTLALGAGDDTFTIHDGTTITGSVDAGSGVDTFNTAIATTASLGAAQGFETLAKTGVGVLNITGPATSTFDTVNVLEGRLDVGALGVLNPTTSTVAAGATLNVDGTFGGDAGTNTMTVAGTVSGTGTIDLQGGDDVLTLNDGANLGGFTGALDGGAATTADTVVLNNAGALTFAAGTVTGFENLAKHNAGVATLTGNVVFTGATTIDEGTLAVAGQLETPTISLADNATLEVSGTAQNAGATAIAISGTAGAGTVRVTSGGTLVATGTLGDGNDTLDIAGTLDIGGGTFDLGAGDDSFVIYGGTNVLGTVVGGAGLDTRIYDLTGTANIGALQQFEGITKRNTGTLNINGPAMTDVLDVSVEGGALNIVGGGLDGVQTVSVSAGATLTVDDDILFTSGADTLTVGGTVSGASTIALLDGDDQLTIQDGADLGGLATSVDGGAGTDTLTADIAGTAVLGGATSFEQLVKDNVGTLNVSGPAASAFVAVTVQGGTLNVGATGNITGVQAATVAAGTTLRVDGTFGGGAGNDTMTVSGTIAGSGTIGLAAGDDVLTLNDGADLSGLSAPLDGGSQATADTIVLNNAAAMTLDAAEAPTGFERLTKENAGVATLSGAFAYTAGTAVNGGTLLVTDALDTPTLAMGDGTTLEVAGTMQNAGGTAVALSGSAGANTVHVTAGATLVATGGVGDGADSLDVAGTLDLGGGTFDLGAGDDSFVIYDGTNVTGTVVAGAGLDTRIFDLVGTADLGALQEFEGLTKRNTGTLNLNGPGISMDLLDVAVEGGTLHVGAGGGITGVQMADVASGATLNVDSDFLFTAGGDTFAVAGTVSGLGSIDMLDGDDLLTVRDGADLTGLATSLEGGTGVDTLDADIATSARLGGATGFETLVKEGVGSLHIVGAAGSQFDTVLVRAGLLEVAAGATVDPQTTQVDAGATLTVDGTYSGTAGADTFTLSGTLSGAGPINLFDGDDVLTIDTGSTRALTSAFDASTGNDRLVLAGAGTDSFDPGLLDTTFRNFEAFRKEGMGTWRLSGAGDHDWTVAEGTLIGDSASFGGNVDNAGTVIFEQAGDGTFAGVLSGGGALMKTGAGTLVVTANNTFTGQTQLVAGGMQVDGMLPGTMQIAAGATLSGIGTMGDVTATADSFVTPGNAANRFGTLTIAGNYSGSATVTIDTVLGKETSATSRLVIHGNTDDASSPVVVNNAGGPGARTAGDGIGIIRVDGASPSSSFRLAQPVQAGAYEYFLHEGGAADPNDWYLRSQYTGPGPEPGPDDDEPAYRPGIAGYVLGHQASLEYGFSALGNLRTRVGDQGRVLDADSGRATEAWMHVQAQELDVHGARFQADDLHMSALQFGIDLYRSESTQSGTHFGVMANIGDAEATFVDAERARAGLAARAGDVETAALGGGLYWTRYGEHGAYLDMSAQVLHYRNRYRDQYLETSSQSGWGSALSLEMGAPYALGSSNWQIEPQLQIGYQRLALDDFKDSTSAIARIDDEALRARAGVQLFRTQGDWLGMSEASPYIALGLQHDFIDADAVKAGATAIGAQLPATTADVAIGLDGRIGAGFRLYLDLRYQQAIEGERDGMRANLGFRKAI